MGWDSERLRRSGKVIAFGQSRGIDLASGGYKGQMVEIVFGF